MKIYKIFLLILLISATSDLSLAQGRGEKNKFGIVIDSIMKQKLVDNLGFDEYSANKFIDVYEANNKQIRLIMKEKRTLMESIEKDTGASDMNDKINKILELETKILDNRKSFFDDLRTFLTPQQIAKTIILRKKINKEMRKEINNRKKENKREKSDNN